METETTSEHELKSEPTNPPTMDSDTPKSSSGQTSDPNNTADTPTLEPSSKPSKYTINHNHNHNHNQDSESESESHSPPSTSSRPQDEQTTPMTISTILTSLAATVTALNTYALPAQLRTSLVHIAKRHPVLASFALCQVLCSAIPLGIFLAGAAISASIAVAVFTCFAALVLLPVLVATTVLGVWLWGVSWGLWVLGRWGVLWVWGSRAVEGAAGCVAEGAAVGSHGDGFNGVYTHIVEVIAEEEEDL
ncbi:hypothetical protein ARAM_000609 [Aspergillus rambellii]|uniref:Uncharacterized protein n=1 Tax=Aspergillus rambellii TaxID=308745 RepID=A0A0F8USC0_9EURO|nr:hypothetical protein ARAM_000609 [Aspergillus rambellii]